MFEKINNYALRCMMFAPEDLEYFDSLLQFKKYPRKSFLLQEGEICQFEAYILKGCIRTYHIDNSGAEVTLQFAVEDWWVSDITSFQNQTPGLVYIETLEDCELLVLTPETKEKLLAKVPGFERMFRLMVQRNLAQLQERLFRTISTTAVEKYLDFLNRYPAIPQRVAQHYIASYLGFSPEFLSKVRKKLSEK
ncbi:Crp/Fnr family transcriptional regulator [Dyadobacter fanqingshengii]|uniref:Crp/Fnr family transcriptional regulator n=1 Tax=Dyadobacter fanqingshengii TaxID=2906443 RepID=A0A9X1TG44_9BACT|nr:Crp/Fnr family transcriptional regulator [Dyadobacter fanqingshengii]MCF0040162.1 Crp/Fnr family transcriptional regulator [Dyadobacter fanqingshengii]USJ38086.1 Crp/Fnr family transcriptional regulator [Dyadobacter fanqingshengii]